MDYFTKNLNLPKFLRILSYPVRVFLYTPLPEFVVLTTTFSAVFLYVSYSVLLHTEKAIPPEMLTTTQVIAAGAVAAVVAKTRQKSHTESYTKQYLVDYALMGLAVTQVILSINYVFLIWVQRSIPTEFAPSIGSLAITILTLTNFRGSNSSARTES